MNHFDQLKADIQRITDPDLRSYVEEIAFADSYWEATKQRSKWHFNYNASPDEREQNSLYRKVGRVMADFQQAIRESDDLVHRAQDISPIMLPSEELDLCKWGYSAWGTDVINATGLLKRIGESLGLKHPDIKYNRQPPGRCKWNHIDSLVSYVRQGHVKSLAEFSQVERVFVMLSDWQPGHFICFGNCTYSQWSAGDVIWFDWRSAPHATANAGHSNRDLLRITGIVDSSSDWIRGNSIKEIIVA